MGQDVRSEGRRESKNILPRRQGVSVKGKPFQPRPKEPVPPVEVRINTVKKTLPSQVSKVDWQSEKFTPEQWRLLNHLHKQFAEFLAAHLTPVLQLRAQVDLKEAKQESFKELLDRLPTPTLVAIFNIDDKSKGLFAIDVSIALAILDYVLGGKGEILEEARELTEIEKVLFQNQILSKFLSTYDEIWKEFAPSSNLKFESLEFSPGNLVIYSYGELVVSAEFTLRVGIASGRVVLVLPFKYVREVIPRNLEQLTTQTFLRKTQEPVAPGSPMMGKKIETTKLNVSVELGNCEVLFQDLLSLEEGDTLVLGTKRGEPLQIKVAERTKFLGKPGASDKKIAVRITDIIEEGDESFDD